MKHLKKLLVKSITLVSLFISVSSCTETDPEATLNNKAPNFNLTSDSGNKISLSDFDGKIKVLFFFGNDCPNCKGVAPKIETDLYLPFKDNKDFVLLGLDDWDGGKSGVDSFKSTTKVTFPLLINASSVTKDYKTTYDRLVLIDKDGTILFSGSQAATNDLNSVKELLSGLIDKDSTEEKEDDNENTDNDDTVEEQIGDAPQFSLKSIEDKTINLSDYKNNVVVIFFFGNNCPTCKSAAPKIESEIFETFKSNSNFTLLGIDTWDGSKTAVNTFKNSTEVSFPLLLNGSDVEKAYKTTYDRLVIINKKGNIVHSESTLARNDISTVKTKVANLLN